MTTTTELLPSYLDVTKLAVASFLARYREPTLTAYTQDLKAFLGWCRKYEQEVLRATRGELEMYVRHLEARGYAAATIARRFGTVATFYMYAVIDGVIPANPADAVTRPKIAWEGQKPTVLHPLELAALLSAARSSSPNDHALICLLGMLGLRISEARAADITDIRYEAGYELLHLLGKGARPADIPLPIPVLRAVREATAGRSSGPNDPSQQDGSGAGIVDTSARPVPEGYVRTAQDQRGARCRGLADHYMIKVPRTRSCSSRTPSDLPTGSVNLAPISVSAASR